MLWGPIVGAVALTVLSELLVDIGPARYLVIATLIVLVLRFFPGGLIGALRNLNRGRPPAGATSTTEA
jgi:branched-chain amino acid transport system permease protein